MKELVKNPNIISASERSISYNPKLKTKAVKEYKKGKSTSQMFIEHGWFNLEFERFGEEACKIMRRWRFFGHFKGLAEYPTCTNVTNVKEEVERVIKEYHEWRYQWE